MKSAAPTQTAKKNGGKSGLVIFILVLAFLSSFLFFQNTLLQSSYQKLQLDYTNLQQNYNSLLSSYEDLHNNYLGLQDQYNTLKIQYDTLNAQYESLNRTYVNLISVYNALKARYDTLEGVYLTLQAQHNAFTASYSRIRMEINSKTGLVSSAWTSLIQPSSWNVRQAVVEARKILALNDYSRIYMWIKNNIKYNYDTPVPILPSSNSIDAGIYWFRDYWQSPDETLDPQHKVGDCEDQAILACSMVKAYWIMYQPTTTYKAWVVLVSGYQTGHAFVLISTRDGNIMILDPAGSQITGLDLLIFQYVTPKPVRDALSVYFSTWKTSGGKEYTTVDGIFSDTESYVLNIGVSELATWVLSH